MEMDEALYEETIYSGLMGGLIILVIILLMFIFLMQYFSGSPVTPQPEWLFFIMLIILFIILNFVRLSLKITSSYVLVAFGLFKYQVPLENIHNYYQDQQSAIRYGGLGIRLNRNQGKWYYGFILNGPRVVLELKDSRLDGFIFTTKNPREVIMILDELNYELE